MSGSVVIFTKQYCDVVPVCLLKNFLTTGHFFLCLHLVGQAIAERLAKQVNNTMKRLTRAVSSYNTKWSGFQQETSLPSKLELKDVLDPAAPVFTHILTNQVFWCKIHSKGTASVDKI